MENKTTKYFKYAIGEIILVVIGILIALQINNWNNVRINSKRETNYVKNIERDLNNQLKAIDTQIQIEANVADYCHIALEPYNETNKLKIDSTFAVALGNIASRRTFKNPNPAYTELISSGNIELLKNEDFKNKLINYYEELERIEEVIEGNNALYTDQEFIPTALKLGVIDSSADWGNTFKNFSRKYSSPNPLTPENMKHLMTLSSKLLELPENELLFVNHIATREAYAMVHVLFLTEFRLQTEKLLETIKAY